MTEASSGNGDSLDEEIAREVIPSRSEEPPSGRKEFKPWHKPRKQFVRRSWSNNAYRLMKKLHVPEGAEKIFRYLTLPGSDMLDVRCLGSVAAQRGFRLHFLAFNAAGRNSEEERGLTLSQNQILSQEWADSSSKIVWQRLENLAAAERSDAYVDAEKHGPYHAINLDFCDSIALRRPIGSPSGLDALGKLLQLQTGICSHDWLLSIVTRVQQADVSSDYLERFQSAIRSNAESSAEFRDALEGLFQRSQLGSDYVLTIPSGLPVTVFMELFCVGLSKWLLKQLVGASPQWGLKMLSNYRYSVYGGEPDMLSLLYRVERAAQHAVAPAGALCGQLPPAQRLDEADLACRIVEKTKHLVDLDAELAAKPELCSALTNETADLLREASYDISAYAEWAANCLAD